MKKLFSAVMVIIVRHWVLVAIFAATASLVIALVESMGRSVWFDESYSIMLAQRPISELLALTSVDAHPPLYYLFLKIWGSLFGWSELSLRLSSAVPAAVGIGFLVALVRQLFTARVAVAVAPFLVLAPFLARYNYEIRMYSLVVCIGVIATWVLVLAYNRRSVGLWLAYAVLVAMGMYTLYMSAVIWLGHVAWLAYRLRQDKKPIIKQQIWYWYIVAVVLFIPWLPTFIYQALHPVLPPYMAAVTIDQLINLISMLLSYHASWQVGAWLSLGILTLAGLLIYLFKHAWLLLPAKYRHGVMLLVACFGVALVIYTLTSLPPIPPRFVERYMVHVAPFMYALLGVVIVLGWRAGKRWQAIITGILSVVLMVGGLLQLNTAGNYNFQRLQAVQAKTVRDTIGCSQTTFITSGPYGYIDMWYEMQACDLRFYYPKDDVFTGGFAPLNGSDKRVKDTNNITTKRVVFLYFDDSTEFMTPDSRYTQVGTHNFGKLYARIYER